MKKDKKWVEEHKANLRGADLSDADLRWADLRWADLRHANLRGANLSHADLLWADLRGAKVSGVRWPSPTMVLSAYWGDIESDDLENSCMHLDMSGHPDPSAFERWAQGGECPYDGCTFQQIVNFVPSRLSWHPECRALSIFELVHELLAEKCIVDESEEK